jgi:hypothetical protein
MCGGFRWGTGMVFGWQSSDRTRRRVSGHERPRCRGEPYGGEEARNEWRSRLYFAQVASFRGVSTLNRRSSRQHGYTMVADGVREPVVPGVSSMVQLEASQDSEE